MNSGGLKIITKVRHRVELENCKIHLDKFIESNLPVKFMTLNLILKGVGKVDVCGEELRNAVNFLGRIVGRIDVEDILDVLFRDFCIGK